MIVVGDLLYVLVIKNVDEKFIKGIVCEISEFVGKVCNGKLS